MKRILLLFGIIIFFVNPVCAGDTLLVSALPSIWAQEKEGRMTGPVIELASKIFSELDVPIESVDLPWARAIVQMKSGELDVMLTIFHSEERAGFMAFTIPYVTVPTSVFVKKGNAFPFRGLKDLIGREGLYVRGGRYGQEFEKFAPQLNLNKVAKIELLIRMLVAKRADYAVCPYYAFLIESRRIGYSDKIEALPLPLISRNLHFGFSKKSPFLTYLPEVNKKIKQLQEDGTIAEMINSAIVTAVGR